MTRLILVSGKGGVGKTTVAAATGLAAARRGYRTLVMSLDLAHSLSDSFNLGTALFSEHKGLPVKITDNLDMQEMDVQEEMERDWRDLHRYTAGLLMGGGLNDVMAEEAAIMPGTEDIIALIYLNKYFKEGKYDFIVLDCPPTGEALRFVSTTSTIDWYVRKRLAKDRKFSGLIRPLASRISANAATSIPQDSYFDALQSLFEKLRGVDELLRDPQITTVRLVTNAEKMVMRETQRAFMYFCLYGMTTDMVVINRLMPERAGYFAQWAKTQAAYSQQIGEYFDPVPIARMPFLTREVVGSSQLEEFAQMLYSDSDPTAVRVDTPAYRFSKEVTKEGTDYLVELRLPFVAQDQLDVARSEDELVVRIGAFKRNIPLPRSIVPLQIASAKLDAGTLTIRFN